ncbi:cytochrome C biogenesis protein [Cephaloticoccus primus]|uniref:Cytochrome C biogenesis protein n=1 Tax=Cephaloticoccus primus TaxID=1548207 RepID=A0A139SQ93_9BACT|nr:cytochrome c biogenesis protein CcsA [Cephaloticoccus primus]KXU36660.1 cytochrome C biogenesis protein [Cephaloticoccus primus]
MKRFLPLLALALGALWLASSLAPRRADPDYDLEGFGRLPILANGRIKPIDTVARSSLLQLQGRQRVSTGSGGSLSPNAWLATVFFDSARADRLRVFEIVHPEVLTLFNLRPEDGDGKKRFSFVQLSGRFPELMRQSQLAQQTESAQRSAFQRAVIQLHLNLNLYHELRHTLTAPESDDFLGELLRFQDTLPAGIAAVRARQAGEPYDQASFDAMLAGGQRYDALSTASSLRPIPPSARAHASAIADADAAANTTGAAPTAAPAAAAPAPSTPALANASASDWRSTGMALLETFETGLVNHNVLAYAGLAHAWRAQKPEQFNEVVRLFRAQLGTDFAPELRKTDIEARFNAAQPFYRSMVLYVLAFVLAIISWLRWPEALGRSAFWLTLLAFIATSAGIATRMWLEGRPPVTNLYSSALFVGWGAVLLCLVLEALFKNAIGSVAGGLIGFAALLIAHHLSLSGDTLEMMRAVLDSNFWLATHVIIITIGYSATFLAGFLALIYIVRGAFTRSLDKPTADALSRMVYGIVCFATLFSLVGTVLGGIWADQSWGRFWGWDPKENGALIIVIWNAIILHARWGGLVRQRGLMCLAVFGNIVTAWSWFGTNMLGIGLHSYGFMDAAFWWLSAFVLSQLALIATALLRPLRISSKSPHT